VDLQDAQPAVWRRFLLRQEATFNELHDAIQVACGWTNSHMYEFFGSCVWHDSIAGVPDPDGFDDRPVVDARVLPVATWFADHEQCLYVYDFGDEWRHVVHLESREVVLPDALERKLLGGERAFPPEDCGGSPAYDKCVAVASRAADLDENEDERHLRQWLQGWEPEHFDFMATAQVFDAAIRRERKRVTKGATRIATVANGPRARASLPRRFEDPLAKELYDRMVSALPSDVSLTPELDELIHDHAVTSAQSTRLTQRIDEVTQGEHVEHRYLDMYLMTLEDTRAALAALAQHSPEHALRAYARFVRRMPQAGQRVNDETEIRDFCEQLLGDATSVLGLVRSGRPERVELLLASIDAWIEDESEHLGFVPKLVARLKLGKRDGRRLLDELGRRSVPIPAHKTEEWRCLLSELTRGT
jgi:hypothetical protein